MQFTAAQLARLIGATLQGDPEVIITAPSKIEEATPGTITFLGNMNYEPFLYTTGASAVLVPRGFEPREPVSATLLEVDDVYMTVSKLLEQYKKGEDAGARNVSEKAAIGDAVSIGNNVGIGHFTVVGDRVRIGDDTLIAEQVYLGPGVRIGVGCRIYPGVRILTDCVIGNNCTLHANVVIGGDGFGFAPDPETGSYSKIPQVGNVVIEDDVEVGANTTIDRASMGSTRIRRGVKLDNLIQVAHNVEIGENTVVAALTGIAGSAKVGANCRIGGQVGISGHIEVADGTQAQAQTGIANNIKRENQELAGTPHMLWSKFVRSSAAFKQLPEFMRDVRARFKRLEAQLPGDQDQ